jgi:hypothetical protein
MNIFHSNERQEENEENKENKIKENKSDPKLNSIIDIINNENISYMKNQDLDSDLKINTNTNIHSNKNPKLNDNIKSENSFIENKKLLKIIDLNKIEKNNIIIKDDFSNNSEEKFEKENIKDKNILKSNIKNKIFKNQIGNNINKNDYNNINININNLNNKVDYFKNIFKKTFKINKDNFNYHKKSQKKKKI